MKRFLVLALILLITACTTTETQPSAETTISIPQPTDVKPYCGDGVCDGPENPQRCPEDCPVPEPDQATSVPADDSSFVDDPEEGVYWLENPTSGAMLYLKVYTPVESGEPSFPALVLIPGGIGDHSDFTGPGKSAQEFADAGFITVTFDPDGRGNATGEEDLNGHIQQDGLAQVIRFTTTLPGVDPSQIGLVSFSYGVTMASGVMARYSDLPVRFFMDWEGPANRFFTTHGCTADHPGIGSTIGMAPCDDEEFWSQREAETFVASIRIPYQRLQFEQDHSQDEPTHALVMINAAVQGSAPWVRLNDLEPNQFYDLDAPPPMFPGRAANMNTMVIEFARELFAQP